MGGASTLTSVLNTSFYHLKFSLQKRKLFRLVLRRSLKKVCRTWLVGTLSKGPSSASECLSFPRREMTSGRGVHADFCSSERGSMKGGWSIFILVPSASPIPQDGKALTHQPRSGAGRLRAQPTGQSILRLLPVAGHMCSEGRPLRAFFWPFMGCSSQRNTFGCTVGLALGDVCAKMLQHQVSYKIEHFLFMTFPDLVVRLLLSSFLFSMLLFNYEWAKITAWGLGVELRLRAWGYIMDGAEEIPSTHQWLYASRCKPYRTIFFGGGDEVQVGEFCQSVLDYVPFGI